MSLKLMINLLSMRAGRMKRHLHIDEMAAKTLKTKMVAEGIKRRQEQWLHASMAYTLSSGLVIQ